MEKITIKIKNKQPKIPETEEERKERIRMSACMRTRVVESKKTYKRNKFKKFDID